MTGPFIDRDRQRERARAKAHRDLHVERTNGIKPSIKRKIACGLILGSFFYLIVSCFGSAVTTPKIERARFKFRHGPDE
jgi:hypothetical protein